MLLICSGVRICENKKCHHRHTHYEGHLQKTLTINRGSCCAMRCCRSKTPITKNHGIELYFECIPWYKGIEETFVHEGMPIKEILRKTRWYDTEAEEDGLYGEEPIADLGIDDDGGSDIPYNILAGRNVLQPGLHMSEPPLPESFRRNHRSTFENYVMGGRSMRATRVVFSEPIRSFTLSDSSSLESPVWEEPPF